VIKTSKNTLVPAIGIIVAAIVYPTMTLLLIVEGEEIGSVAEWVAALGTIFVGLVAAAFAALAWTESKRATHATEQATAWAKIAAEAQQRANALTEAELLPTITVNLEEELTSTGITVPAIALITIELKDDSPAPIWVRAFTTVLAVLEDAEETSNWYETDRNTHRPFDNTLPWKLLPGHKLAETDPYHDLYEGKLLSGESLILCDIEYSFTEDGPIHSITHMTVNLDARSNIVWMA